MKFLNDDQYYNYVGVILIDLGAHHQILNY